jgi:hypothetical protein
VKGAKNSGSASGGKFTLTGLGGPKRTKAMEWPRPTNKSIRQPRPKQ